MNIRAMLVVAAALVVSMSGCANTDQRCALDLKPPLAKAVVLAEEKLANHCEYYFEGYFEQLMALAEDHPDRDNKRVMSDHLVRVSELGVITHRQAQERYNRFFNVKFVALTGDYNTCSQTCPVRHRVLAAMSEELLDKERGLMKASADPEAYYRADHLLKETQLVLEATCKACTTNSVGAR
jgi:hypothetical protein